MRSFLRPSIALKFWVVRPEISMSKVCVQIANLMWFIIDWPVNLLEVKFLICETRRYMLPIGFSGYNIKDYRLLDSYIAVAK